MPTTWTGFVRGRVRRALAGAVLALVASAPASLSDEVRDEVRLPNLELALADARNVRAADLKGPSGAVVFFLSTECPIANAYVPTIVRLAKRAEAAGMSAILVNPNDGQNFHAIEAHRRAFRIPFPVYKDASGKLAAAVGATHCPSACVFDKAGVRRYAGRIDDRYFRRGGSPREVSVNDLEDAIEAVLAGRAPARGETTVVGCPIPHRSKRSSSAAQAGGPTFTKEVVRILQKHCQECHRSGGVGPFPLLTYSHALDWADDIVEFTSRGAMPPWKPVDGHGEFRDRRRMSGDEIATLAAWVEAGCPEGEKENLPPPVVFQEGWTRGVPDVVLDPGEDFVVDAEGRDVYRNFVFKIDADRDLYASAYEVLPSNRRVVHHVLIFMDRSGRAESLDARDPGPGYESTDAISTGLPGFLPDVLLGGWAPGNGPHVLPRDTVFVIPKGANLIVQVHYSKTGKQERDRTRIGLYLAKDPPKRAFGVMPVEPLSGRIGLFLIPKGASHHRVQCSVDLPEDLLLISVTPHMHLLGKDMKVEARLPDGREVPLVYVKDWDFNWQETYFYKEPMVLPKGTRVTLTAHYDNSENNPSNPSRPPIPVRYGEETRDEMCICFLGGAPVREASSPKELRAPQVADLFGSEVDRIRRRLFGGR